MARVLAKAARAVETQTSAIFFFDKSVIDDLIALVEMKVAVSVTDVDILVEAQVLGLSRWNPLSLKRRETSNTCGHCQFATLLESRWTFFVCLRQLRSPV